MTPASAYHSERELSCKCGEFSVALRISHHSTQNAFEQLSLAGADPRPGLKNDADPHQRHAALCHAPAFKIALKFPVEAIVHLPVLQKLRILHQKKPIPLYFAKRASKPIGPGSIAQPPNALCRASPRNVSCG
jgi:hypothetical protein